MPESLAGDIVALLTELRKEASSPYGNPTLRQHIRDAADVITQLLENPTPQTLPAGDVELGEGALLVQAWTVHGVYVAPPEGTAPPTKLGVPGLMLDLDVVRDGWPGARRIRLLAAGPAGEGLQVGINRSVEMLVEAARNA